jgi:hypothetical protein
MRPLSSYRCNWQGHYNLLLLLLLLLVVLLPSTLIAGAELFVTEPSSL